MATQLPRARAPRAADDVIDNSGPPRGDRAAGRSASIGAIASSQRAPATLATGDRSWQNDALAERIPARDPLRAPAERAHPHADAARGPVRARRLLRGAGRGARAPRGAARAVRDHRRRRARRSQGRPAAGARAAEAGARRRCAATRTSSSRRWRRCSPISMRSARSCSAQQGKVGHAPARQRMADGDQAAHRDSRRRLRVRPARLSLLAEPGRRQQRRHDLADWIEPFVPIARRRRDRAAAAARERPHRAAMSPIAACSS